MRNIQGCCRLICINLGNNTLQDSSCMTTYLPSHKPFKKVEQDTVNTAVEVKTSSKLTFSDELLRMDTLELADQQKFTFTGSARTLDAFKRTDEEWWPIKKDGEMERVDTLWWWWWWWFGLFFSNIEYTDKTIIVTQLS